MKKKVGISQGLKQEPIGNLPRIFNIHDVLLQFSGCFLGLDNPQHHKYNYLTKPGAVFHFLLEEKL